MQGNFQLITDLINDRNAIDNYITNKTAAILGRGKKAVLKVEEYNASRSISANNLYWMWIGQILDYNSNKFKGYYEIDENGKEVFIELPLKARKDAMHMWLKDRFLGWTPRIKMGNRIIEPQLKSTKDLNSSEMCFYMEKVDNWASSKGWLLKKPRSEYVDFLEQQER